MKVQWGSVHTDGVAIDLREPGIGVEAVWEAVTDRGDDRIDCRVPPPVIERVGVVTRSVSLSVRTAIAEAMRTHRVETPVDHGLARAERERDALAVPTAETTVSGADLQSLTTDETALRERVARLGGRVDALREQGGDVDTAIAELETAITKLSEIETERLATEQQLESVRDELRTVRDVREARRRLNDRIDNRRRITRDWLVDTYYPRFRAAVERIPGDANPGQSPREYSGPDWVAAVATLAMTETLAPAVIGADLPFDTVTDAYETVGSPVILVEV